MGWWFFLFCALFPESGGKTHGKTQTDKKVAAISLKSTLKTVGGGDKTDMNAAEGERGVFLGAYSSQTLIIFK